MTQANNLCPNNNDGNHRYFVFKTAEIFVPYNFVLLEDGTTKSRAENMVLSGLIDKLPALYEKKEQAVLGCNCGSVIKTEVKGQ